MPANVQVDLSALGHRYLEKMAIPRRKLDAIGPRLRKILKKIEEERSGGLHRYRDLPRDHVTRRAIEAVVRPLRGKTDNLVVLGIGGSALGNIALHDALNPAQYNLLSRRKRRGPRLFVMDNVDPARFASMLDVVKHELDRTVFNVISKSGETAETACQFLIVRDLLRRRLGAEAARKQMWVTTDTRSGTMRSIVDSEGYASLPVPDGVGGRFSVLSAVGLFSAAMCGIDIAELLRGAADMDKQVSAAAPSRNPAAQLAAVNYLCYKRGQPMAVMMPYSNGLYGLADWFRQLWAESLGKCHTRTGRPTTAVGPTPIKALGATDQHSQVQLYREGPNDKLIMFLEVLAHERDVKIPMQLSDVPAMSYLGGQTMGALLAAEKRATEMALLRSQRPNLTIHFPEVSPFAVGGFIYLLEATTTIMGYLLGIDPYDQPGVELGKKITYHLMGREGFSRLPE
jgi:glucose-6-phosphate isomerase